MNNEQITARSRILHDLIASGKDAHEAAKLIEQFELETNQNRVFDARLSKQVNDRLAFLVQRIKFDLLAARDQGWHEGFDEHKKITNSIINPIGKQIIEPEDVKREDCVNPIKGHNLI